MALTDIDIASEALTLIEADTIDSFDGGSREAEVMARIFKTTFDSCLSASTWNFATKDQQLNNTGTAPVDKRWAYSFTLPSDFIRRIEVMDPTGIPYDDWTVQGTQVLANRDPLILKYVARPADYAALPPWFVEYLIASLAAKAARPITSDDSMAEWARREMDYRLGLAKAANSEEIPNVSAYRSSLLAARVR